jgi:LmbE family N-acetylglucosaminyl deacetylase
VRFDDRLEIERVMVIYAHADDAEFGVAGTVAKWVRAGVEVTYCMVTNGASGSQDPQMDRPRLREIRLVEQRAAARILGVKEVVFLDFEDGYLEPTLKVRKAVSRQIRRLRPDVIITLDPTARFGGNFYVNHPDHIAVGEVVLRAINPDASTRLMFPELWRDERLEPHKPKALFLMAFDHGDTSVDITDTIEIKLEALRAHRSQLEQPDFERLVRDFARVAGRRAGVQYAEAFRVIRLDAEPSFEEMAAEDSLAQDPGRRAP